jgi:hypothetical protein
MFDGMFQERESVVAHNKGLILIRRELISPHGRFVERLDELQKVLRLATRVIAGVGVVN